MFYQTVKKVVLYVPNKIEKINYFANKILDTPDKVGNAWNYSTKVVGATTGSAGLAKRAVDLTEAILCQDGVCATLSLVGMCADSVQVMASTLKQPNATILFTLPVSTFCKVYVNLCKGKVLPWRSC